MGKDNGLQSMLIDQTANLNLTKSQYLAVPYQWGNVKHRGRHRTNFQLISLPYGSVFKAAWKSFRIR